MSGRIKLMQALILTLMAVAGSLNQVKAQKANLSDWRVPPPLAPGNLTKGNTTGRAAKSSPIVLTLSDIPAPLLPASTPVQLPVLAAIGIIPPSVNTPDQPAVSGNDAGLPDIPSPDAPETPSLPKQSPQDAPIPATIEFPAPTAPEMPTPPAEPGSSGQTPGVKGPVLIMPDVIIVPPPKLPPATGGLSTWPTLGIPENESVKLTESKGSKGTGKVKSP